MTKNCKNIVTTAFAISLVVTFGLVFAASASASTLTVSGSCVDDDLRISKNGSVVYDGNAVNSCSTLSQVVQNVNCDDVIKIDVKDNHQVEVGFKDLTLTMDGKSKTFTQFMYQGSWVLANTWHNNIHGELVRWPSLYPSVRYYATEINGTLREMGLCTPVVVTPVCSSASDCGTSGYTGSPFCNGNNVYQKYVTYTCNNAGTANSSCSSSTADQLKTTCSANQTCTNGSCVNQNITCSSNADCGTSSYVGSPFCQGNNVYQNYLTYTCNNAGSANSYCSNSTAPKLKNSCSGNQTCNNGSCENQNIACSSNTDCGTSSYTGSPFCNGNNVYQNYLTYTCNNAGSANSYCSSSTTQQLKNTCSGNQTCNNGSCSNQNITCSSSSDCGTSGYTGSAFCNGNSVYQNYTTYTCNNAGSANSYCSNSTNQQLKTTCYGNQTCNNGSCSGNNCTQNSYQRCNGNYLYWYDSCGNQGNLSQYCPNGCNNNTCQYNNTTNLNINRTVKNLTTNSGWSTSVNASPSDMLMFMTTLQAQGSDAQNVTLRDYLPSGLTYNNQLTVSWSNGSNYNYSGTPTTGLYLNTLSAGQTVTVTYQVQVADAGNFSYGSTTLNANSSVTSSNGSNPTSSTPITVTKAAVYGASTVSTGLTNNIWVDSFFLPALITLLAIWMWKAGLLFGIEKWLGNKKQTRHAYNSEKELASRIAEIQETETI